MSLAPFHCVQGLLFVFQHPVIYVFQHLVIYKHIPETDCPVSECILKKLISFSGSWLYVSSFVWNATLQVISFCFATEELELLVNFQLFYWPFKCLLWCQNCYKWLWSVSTTSSFKVFVLFYRTPSEQWSWLKNM